MSNHQGRLLLEHSEPPKPRGLKLFISYSHKDNDIKTRQYINEFKTHITPLKELGIIEDWYDRKNLAGDIFQHNINNNLDDSDIICLFISSHFLASPACKDEIKKSIDLRYTKGVTVIPIILSHCGWIDFADLKQLLALPIDGKPISSFADSDFAWNQVYEELRRVAQHLNTIKNIRLKPEFLSFLNDTELLEKSHSSKDKVFLDDIFIYPDLVLFNEMREYKERLNASKVIPCISKYSRIVFAGEERSGKTTLCKVIFKELRKNNFIPIYISHDDIVPMGLFVNLITKKYLEEYDDPNITDYIVTNREKIVPIIDNFHFVKNKEKYLSDLLLYSHCIVTVDDIFSLNVKEETLVSSFLYYQIKEMKASQRYELIKKWVDLKETTDQKNDLYRNLDIDLEIINSTLGKTIGSGILPSYPFFILSAIAVYEAFSMPLNQEITSQGYCYQALIYFYLRKQGVPNDLIDVYLNFLTELAYYIYEKSKKEITQEEYEYFMKAYLDKYNLPIREDMLLKNICFIFSFNSFGMLSFKYSYLYYFFVAKYLSDHSSNDDIKKVITGIVSKLYTDDNAYISVFLAHHSKNTQLFDDIYINALYLFDSYNVATLTNEEAAFFDKQLDLIIDSYLPDTRTTPEEMRSKQLEMEDKMEERKEKGKNTDEKPAEDGLAKDLRLAVKTVEVIGCIIKNRAGSIEKSKLEGLFAEAMNILLRILSSFFEIIKDEEGQRSIIEFISKQLEKLNKEKDLTKADKIREASIIFWNINFFFVYGIINKIVLSLGSDKLISITNKVCDESNTPASFLVKNKILMWYKKNIQIDELIRAIDNDEFSEIAKRAIKRMVVEHCATHLIGYKERQRLESGLKLRTNRLLKCSE